MDVVDLCDSDEDVAVVATTPGVARLPSPRSRKRNAEDDDSDMEVVYSPAQRRKKSRATGKANLKSDDDDIEFLMSIKGVPTTRPQVLKSTHGKARLKSDDDGLEFLSTKAAPTPKPLSNTPLQQVLEVFPDVAIAHANALLKKHNNVAANVMNDMLLNLPYPEEEAKKPAAGNMGVVNMTTKPKYDFMSASSFQPSKEYIEQSIDQLVRDFPGLSKKGAKFFLEKGSNHYAISHSKLFRALTDTTAGKASLTTPDDAEIGQYEKLKNITAGKVFDEEQKKRLKEPFNCSPRKDHFLLRRRATQSNDLNISDPILLEEVAFVKHKLGEWKGQVETKIQLKINRELAIKDGTAMECSCCMEEVAMEELVQCDGGHLFCQGCLEQYLTNSVFSNQSFGKHPKTKEENLELVCFSGEGCSSGFERGYLVRVRPKVLEKYDELCALRTIEKAGLRDEMCTCPSCGYSASLAETDNVFSCPACNFSSCRHCGEPSHIPLRCNEVEKKQEEDARTRVEEAASAAVIRFCPKCKKGVIKSDGCNKITCPCGVKWCYLCRKLVTDYTHFCQIPHCTHSGKKKKCNGCPLWTKDLDEAHDKERRAAVIKEASRVEAEATTATAKPPGGLFATNREASAASKDKVHVDVEGILKAPKNKPGRAH